MPWDSHIMLLVNSFSVFAYFPVPRKNKRRTSKLLFLFWIFFHMKTESCLRLSSAQKRQSIKLHKLHIYFHGILYFLNVSAFLYSRCRNYFTLSGPAEALSFTHDRLFRCTVFEFSNSLSQSVNRACEAINTRRLFYYMKKRNIETNSENYVFSQHKRWKNSLDSAMLSSMAFRRAKRK